MANPKCPYCGEEMLLHEVLGDYFYMRKREGCKSMAPMHSSEQAAYAAAGCLPVVNWHKFDANDLDTYPQAYKSKLLFHRDGYVEEGRWLGVAEKWQQYYPNDVMKPDEVLYWCDLPKPPKEWMLENCCCFEEANDE